MSMVRMIMHAYAGDIEASSRLDLRKEWVTAIMQQCAMLGWMPAPFAIYPR